jgi:hypothetical protein
MKEIIINSLLIYKLLRYKNISILVFILFFIFYFVESSETECHYESVGFELTTLAVLGIDCMGSCKSNYHTITTTVGRWCLKRTLCYTVTWTIFTISGNKIWAIKTINCKTFTFIMAFGFTWFNKIRNYNKFIVNLQVIKVQKYIHFGFHIVFYFLFCWIKWNRMPLWK